MRPCPAGLNNWGDLSQPWDIEGDCSEVVLEGKDARPLEARLTLPGLLYRSDRIPCASVRAESDIGDVVEPDRSPVVGPIHLLCVEDEHVGDRAPIVEEHVDTLVAHSGFRKIAEGA